MDTSEAMVRTRVLLAEFGLPGWTAALDRSVRRFGVCRYASHTISLSEKLVRMNDAGTVEDTIRHEIAHALAGPAAKHGPKWRAQCRVTGATPERCYDAAQVNTPEAPWRLLCVKHGVSVTRFRRKAGNWHHGRCSEIMIWEQNH